MAATETAGGGVKGNFFIFRSRELARSISFRDDSQLVGIIFRQVADKKIGIPSFQRNQSERTPKLYSEPRMNTNSHELREEYSCELVSIRGLTKSRTLTALSVQGYKRDAPLYREADIPMGVFVLSSEWTIETPITRQPRKRAVLVNRSLSISFADPKFTGAARP